MMLPGFEDLEIEIEGKETGAPKYKEDAPLAVRMRPNSLDELIGQDDSVAKGTPLRRMIEGKAISLTPSIILWGPPGTGKTTIAYLIAQAFDSDFIEVSAVSDNSAMLKSIINEAKIRKGNKKTTVLFIDEIHRFNKAQQDILLPAVENQWVTLVSATTENPSFSIISPLISRSIVVRLRSLDEKNIVEAVERALKSERGYNGKYSIESDAAEALARFSGGDVRKALTVLEAAVASSRGSKISLKTLEKVSDGALVRWDADQHYDVISAFIKSMRGSDPDATLHYLARMIKAGEDPRFIARRIMIAASEEVGLADSSILTTATSAAEAVAKIGMPEARIILAHAALAVALAPKSNAAYEGIDKALKDVEKGVIGEVPMHLRDTHYEASAELGHGEAYIYAHDEPGGIATQEYLPEKLRGKVYYEPTSRGREKAISERLPKIREILSGEG